MIVRNLELALKTAYVHGQLDRMAGTPCDSAIPLRVYDTASQKQAALIKRAWTDGWKAGKK